MIFKTTHEDKTKHPGLGHFNANEWLQFAEMHFRHHLRQEKRIEDFLASNYQNSTTITKDIQEVYKSLTKHIPNWWTEDFSGASSTLNDEFTVRFGTTFKTMKDIFRWIQAINATFP